MSPSARLNESFSGVVCDIVTVVRQEKRLQSIKTTADWLQSRTKYRPKVAVICGSGLGSFGDCIENVDIFEYSDIPHFVTCTG